MKRVVIRNLMNKTLFLPRLGFSMIELFSVQINGNSPVNNYGSDFGFVSFDVSAIMTHKPIEIHNIYETIAPFPPQYIT